MKREVTIYKLEKDGKTVYAFKKSVKEYLGKGFVEAGTFKEYKELDEGYEDPKEEVKKEEPKKAKVPETDKIEKEEAKEEKPKEAKKSSKKKSSKKKG